jgi:hypothetical protein
MNQAVDLRNAAARHYDRSTEARSRSSGKCFRSVAGVFLRGFGIFMAAYPGSVLACAACYGQSDSPLAAGMNWGILCLLGFIGGVLGGVAAFFIFLARRSRRVEAENTLAEQQTLPGLGSEPQSMAGLAERGLVRPSGLLKRRSHCPPSRAGRGRAAVLGNHRP